MFRYVSGCVIYVLFGALPGRLEPGETNYQAAVRETAEETGLREHQLKVVDGFQRVLHYTSYNKLKDVTYWLAELLDGEAHIILSKEHTEFQWLSLNEACINMHYEDMKKAVTDAHEFLLTQS